MTYYLYNTDKYNEFLEIKLDSGYKHLGIGYKTSGSSTVGGYFNFSDIESISNSIKGIPVTSIRNDPSMAIYVPYKHVASITGTVYIAHADSAISIRAEHVPKFLEEEDLTIEQLKVIDLKNIEWIKGYVVIQQYIPGRITRKDILEYAGAVFGEENVEIQNNSLIIYYPTVEITNGSIKRTLHDFFVRIGLTNQLQVGSLEGMKTSYTDAEYNSYYIHSHISGGNSISWDSFCTGGDNTDLSIARTKYNATLTKDDFLQFLLTITPFVKWESIAGGPHKRLSSVRSSGRSTVSSISDYEPTSAVLKQALNYAQFQEGKIVVDRENLEKDLFILDQVKSIRNAVCVRINGSFHAIAGNSSSVNNSGLWSTQTYQFRGKTFKHKKIEEINTEEHAHILNPGIIQSLTNKIQGLYDIYASENFEVTTPGKKISLKNV